MAEGSSGPVSPAPHKGTKVYYQNAGWLNRISFSWMNRVLARGRANKLRLSDLQLPKSLYAEKEYNRFQVEWQKQVHSGDPSLVRALWNCYAGEFLRIAFIKLCWGALLLFTAFFLVRSLVAFVGDKTLDDMTGYGLSIGFFFSCFLMSMCQQQLYHLGAMQGVRVRGAVTTAVYRKALRTENVAQQSSDVLNLITNDCYRLFEACTTIHFVWSGPIEALTIIGLLISLIGYWGLVALGVVAFLLPVQLYIGKTVAQLRSENIQTTDHRVHLMHEILMNIKLVKFYAWEESFMKQVAGLRDEEMKVLQKSAFLKSINLMMVFLLPPGIAVLLFSLYLAFATTDYKLPTTLAFTTLSLFNTLRFPLVVLPKSIKGLAEALAAAARIQKFLLLNECSRPGQAVVSAVPSSAQAIEMEVKDSTPPGVLSFEHADLGYLKAVPLDEKEHKQDEHKQSEHNDEVVTVVRNVHFHLTPGKTMALVGPVGSGKSSILMAALGEARAVSGVVKCGGRVAFVPQFPWIQMGNVRDNILFGLPYDEEKYRRIIHACALERDLSIMPQGDMTPVAERGTNLSGGQRQRISIARAAYAESDVYLMDSPLSAVDWHTANHIMYHCIKTLLRGKTVVMVTHQLSLLNEFDLVGIVLDGRIPYSGPFNPRVMLEYFPSFAAEMGAMDHGPEESLLYPGPSQSVAPKNSKPDPDAAVAQEGLHSDIDTESESGDEPTLDDAGQPEFTKEEMHKVEQDMVMQQRRETLQNSVEESHAKHQEEEVSRRSNSIVDVEIKLDEQGQAVPAQTKRSPSLIAAPPAAPPLPEPEAPPANMESMLPPAATGDEEMKAGADAIKAWVAEGGTFLFCLAVFIAVFTQVTRIISDWWIRAWVAARYPITSKQYNYIYIGMVFLFGILLQIRGMAFYKFAIGAATSIHNSMFSRVLRAPISFFSVRPLGGVLDAFSRHQDVCDEALPDTSHLTKVYILQLSTTLILVMVVLPVFTAIAVALFVFFFLLLWYYLATAARLKQLVSQTSSPVLSHAAESVDGISVVRAFDAEARFAHQSVVLVDAHHSAVFSLEELQGWLAHRLDFIASLLVFFTAILCVTDRKNNLPADTGLAISNSLQALVFFTWVVRGLADSASLFNSVQRIQNLRQSVHEEAATRIADQKPSDNWPARGEITFQNVTMRYLPWMEPALKSVTFTIHHGEKIGIIGRTGSGKSSLIMALFRMAELDNGDMFIDGRDIRAMGLSDLRERLAIIPQEPVMFKGTIRSNLDPFNQHTDADLVRSLEIAKLESLVKKLEGGLDAIVEENGRNFSLGQKQLLCLSRAFLRKSTILVLDEATAAMDQETDHMMQTVVREQFAQCTVITIAHRLHSIIDSDRILGMSAGVLIEFDEPINLLQTPQSLFASLVDQAGDQREVLRSMAMDAARKKCERLGLPLPPILQGHQ
eukprot:TRINITY_DN320_c0_g1_i19.p1 TRINITY_DN320_c0_g1~~TRINITY_DN320_c0_g1_i19.p1  ORF type:complete len:1436 (+),score=492.77 TRINITY_DN320_c0_g1_i19:117-4424(+)